MYCRKECILDLWKGSYKSYIWAHLPWGFHQCNYSYLVSVAVWIYIIYNLKRKKAKWSHLSRRPCWPQSRIWKYIFLIQSQFCGQYSSGSLFEKLKRIKFYLISTSLQKQVPQMQFFWGTVMKLIYYSSWHLASNASRDFLKSCG